MCIIKFHNHPKFQSPKPYFQNSTKIDRLLKKRKKEEEKLMDKYGKRTPELFMPKLLSFLPIELKSLQSSQTNFKRLDSLAIPKIYLEQN